MLDDKGVFHWKQPVSLYFSFSLVEGIKPIEIRLKKKGKSIGATTTNLPVCQKPRIENTLECTAVIL